jgi:hypothetical protein
MPDESDEGTAYLSREIAAMGMLSLYLPPLCDFGKPDVSRIGPELRSWLLRLNPRVWRQSVAPLES